jgi:hypothetical protein
LLSGVLAAIMGAGAPSRAAAADCPPPPDPVYPFLAWGDWAPYVPATGGTFEAGVASWSLSGGATVVNENTRFLSDSPTSTRSLYLPAGASATSRCVTAPKIVGIVRFFVRNARTSTGQLKVEVLVKGKTYPAGTFSAQTAWAPTPVLVSTAPQYKGAVTYQVRISALGTDAAFMIDDVYFDPFRGR